MALEWQHVSVLLAMCYEVWLWSGSMPGRGSVSYVRFRRRLQSRLVLHFKGRSHSTSLSHVHSKLHRVILSLEMLRLHRLQRRLLHTATKTPPPPGLPGATGGVRQVWVGSGKYGLGQASIGWVRQVWVGSGKYGLGQVGMGWDTRGKV